MYPTLLATHSSVRWFLLASLVIAIFQSYNGWRSKKTFSRFDNAIRLWTTVIAHVQLVLGLSLYFISPIVNYFLRNFKDGIHQREIRFFGMEHSLMMVLAVAVITIGSVKSKRMATDLGKHKAMAIWYTIGLFFILTSIPWAFSPLVSRPHFRPFF